MELRKLSYVLAFVLAASFGAFACGDEEDPKDDKKGTCEEPLVACGDTCVDTQTNKDHCGACNNACAEGEVCEEGVCVGGSSVECETDDECDEGFVCNEEGKCVEETTEPECESDDDCEGDLVCVDGYCADDVA